MYRGMQPFGQAESEYSNRNIYLRGLSPETSDQNLLELCSLYGPITSAKAIIDKDTSKCKGYGFVMFDSVEVAEKARQGLIQSGFQASFAKLTYNEKMMGIQGTPHPPEASGFGGKMEDPTNLYISNLPLTYTDQELSNLLGKYGRVVSTRILVDKYTGASRGIALARMSTHEECEAAVTKLNNMQLEGGAPLQVKFADNPSVKRANKPWQKMNQPGMYGVMQHQYHSMDHMSRPANPTSYMGMHGQMGGQPVSPRMPSYPPYAGGYTSYPMAPYPMMGGMPPSYNHGQMQ